MAFNFSSMPNSQTEDQIWPNIKSPELFGQHLIPLPVPTSNSESKGSKCKEKSGKAKKQPSENLSSNACANWTTPMLELLLKSHLDTQMSFLVDAKTKACLIKGRKLVTIDINSETESMLDIEQVKTKSIDVKGMIWLAGVSFVDEITSDNLSDSDSSDEHLFNRISNVDIAKALSNLGSDMKGVMQSVPVSLGNFSNTHYGADFA
ncbi:hypothetical protein HK096_005960 [Nowakowskiella sp. JEL0078]|nr:hypothetical protein HK096_005960 [Nowakowskiella sp. JEL0078]